MKGILVIHGPNLNLLGKREPAIYGKTTLKKINAEMEKLAKKEKIPIFFFQSNIEGEIVDKIQAAEKKFGAIVLNAAAYTHTSVAIRDAVAAVEIPVVEVHLSNIAAREKFRRKSYLSPVVAGVIFGFGKESYLLGLKGAITLAKSRGHFKTPSQRLRRVARRQGPPRQSAAKRALPVDGGETGPAQTRQHGF